MPQPGNPQSRIDAFLSEPVADQPALLAAGQLPLFSPFDDGDAGRATELFERFNALADAAAGREQALDEVLAAARELRPADPALVDFALGLFITHHPRARGLEVTPLEVRAPAAVLPSIDAQEPGLLGAMPGREPELAWFREDAKANEHHEHWHYVFWRNGRADRTLKDRHGEMFFYMHQQMLARYEAERRALGIDAVEELAPPYSEPIGEGYDPGPGFRANPGPWMGTSFAPRPAGARVQDAQYLSVMMATGQRLRDAVAAGEFRDGTAVDADTLGLAVENATGVRHGGAASTIPVDFYGNFHGYGHVATGRIGGGAGGVMLNPATAIRDPVFWRWHRHVDTVNYEWQQRQEPWDFSGDGPEGVRVRDVILAFKDQIPGLADRAAGEAFGREAFGGGRWDDDFSASGEHSTDVLETMMCRRPLTDRDGQPLGDEFGEPYTLNYVDQRPFVYFVRLENGGAEPREVTVRTWIVPAEAAEDRRAWIEMDKFRATLQPGAREVVYRPAQESSVIRKPAQKPPVSYLDPPAFGEGEEPDEENYCTCGWPYNLLLPRGNAEGAAYRLMVVATDYARDRVAPRRPAGRTCGSVSFCGLRDDSYPDAKPMGYPFHRRFDGEISGTLERHPFVAARGFTIRLVEPQGEPPQYHEAPIPEA